MKTKILTFVLCAGTAISPILGMESDLTHKLFIAHNTNTQPRIYRTEELNFIGDSYLILLNAFNNQKEHINSKNFMSTLLQENKKKTELRAAIITLINEFDISEDILGKALSIKMPAHTFILNLSREEKNFFKQKVVNKNLRELLIKPTDRKFKTHNSLPQSIYNYPLDSNHNSIIRENSDSLEQTRLSILSPQDACERLYKVFSKMPELARILFIIKTNSHKNSITPFTTFHYVKSNQKNATKMPSTKFTIARECVLYLLDKDFSDEDLIKNINTLIVEDFMIKLGITFIRNNINPKHFNLNSK